MSDAVENTNARDGLIDLRRELHQHPEPAWCEFYTTNQIVAELSKRDVELEYGPTIHGDQRVNVPDPETLEAFRSRALSEGASESVIDELGEGYTGAVATVENGPSPVVALRVDIDGLPITESSDESHEPARAGFRSVRDAYMHSCGHDGHMAIGIGVLDALLSDGFDGTLKVIFQPGEEELSGATSMVDAGVLEGVDYFIAPHLGLGHPTGTIVAGYGGFFAVQEFRAEFTGEAAHAAKNPSGGKDAVRSLGTAINDLYGISRYVEGDNRINVGKVGGGTATNIVPESSFLEAEVRARNATNTQSMYEAAKRVLSASAEMNDLEVAIEGEGSAPAGASDAEFIDIVAQASEREPAVNTVVDGVNLGASEDATAMMKYVQERGGCATYIGVGTDHPAGHHTPEFDIDETSIAIGVSVISETLKDVFEAN